MGAGQSFARLACGFVALAGVAGCAARPSAVSFPIGQYAQWTHDTPAYRLFPGDTVAIDVRSAPELSQDAVLIGPDGRAGAAFAGDVVLAGRTVPEARRALEYALARELRDPSLELRAVGFASQQIFVGGEVRQPGAYQIPGEIGPLEAVLLAGGFENTARAREVVVVRRGPDGRPMLAVVDLAAPVKGQAGGDIGPLQRFDIVFVPRSTIAEVNLFVQQYFRDALPIQFGFYYDISGNNN